MGTGLGDGVVGVFVGLLGLGGLALGLGARDGEMFVFGFSLAAFSALFVRGLIRQRALLTGRVAEEAAAKTETAAHV